MPDYESLLRLPANRSVVVGTGLITLDIVISPDTNHAPRLYAGGTCGNVLTALSYLGWKSCPVARLNGDIASKRVLKDLALWGVDVRYAKQQPGTSTPIIVHLINRKRNGTPSHKFSWVCPQCGAWLPHYKAITASAADEVAAQLKEVKVFFMDRVSRGVLRLAKACADKGALVVFEPSSTGDPKLFCEALALTHILKYSRDRVASFGDLIKSSRKPLLEIETRGNEGLYYRSRLPAHMMTAAKELVAIKVPEFRDAAGAGDWCTAGIIHVLGQQGAPGLARISSDLLEGALRLGQAMASWTCCFEGARAGMYSANRRAFSTALLSLIKDLPAGRPAKLRECRSSVVLTRSAAICPAC